MRLSRARLINCWDLKENVIIGKLIPAGTGMSRYGRVKIETQSVEPAETTTTTSQASQ
jgi:hypothetical protein